MSRSKPLNYTHILSSCKQQWDLKGSRNYPPASAQTMYASQKMDKKLQWGEKHKSKGEITREAHI